MDVCRSDGKFVLKLDGPTSPTPPSPPLACQLPSQHYISLLKVFLPRLQHPPSVVSLLVHQKIGLTILAGTVAVINHFHSQLCIYLCWQEPRLYWHNWHRHHHHVYHVRAGHSTPGKHTSGRQRCVMDLVPGMVQSTEITNPNLSSQGGVTSPPSGGRWTGTLLL